LARSDCKILDIENGEPSAPGLGKRLLDVLEFQHAATRVDIESARQEPTTHTTSIATDTGNRWPGGQSRFNRSGPQPAAQGQSSLASVAVLYR
jgi:hypothetical protein